MSEHDQKEQNRSSAMSPEQVAQTNAMVSAAVAEAVRSMFTSFAPMLEKLAITPEKLREANKPYVDPAKAARELREMLLWKEDEAENRRKLQEYQDNCPHIDQNGRSSITLVHNFPDRQPRGLCTKCQALIHPREWRIAAPDAKHPRGNAYLTEAHKNYNIVMQLEARA